MTSARSAEASRHRFNDLVASGAYGAGFTHPKPARDFVGIVVRELLDEIETPNRTLSVLDAGCGNGAWLHFLHGLAASRGGGEPRLYGFDVADRMVETADQHLSALAAPVRLQRGDILSPESYRFADGQDRFDLVFAYDVVQQVASGRQFDAVAQLADAVKPGGRAVVFDHERWSRYGLRMAYRKFVTATFGIPLVPRYFCAASYPPLNRLAQRISAAANVSAQVVVEGHPRKRALVLRRIAERS
jgi:SAM-dependent methyltransferase